MTKMILTYKFLCGVLLRMHDRSADGVFHLAILALLKTRQTLIGFHLCPPRLLAGESKNDFYINFIMEKSLNFWLLEI